MAAPVLRRRAQGRLVVPGERQADAAAVEAASVAFLVVGLCGVRSVGCGVAGVDRPPTYTVAEIGRWLHDFEKTFAAEVLKL